MCSLEFGSSVNEIGIAARERDELPRLPEDGRERCHSAPAQFSETTV